MTIVAFQKKFICVRIQKNNMKLSYFLFFTISTNIISLFAATDSVSLGQNKDRTVFYSFRDGKVADIRNDDWHLAFSCRPAQFPSNTLQSATIRINEAYGVKLFKVPGKTPDDFNQIDTTGWRNWVQLHDSDTSLWMGAFNRNINRDDAFNYGWGTYSFTAHSVVGDSLFLLQLPNGSLKKIAVLKNEYDSAFIIQYANLDNSQNTTTKISKRQYKTKNFVYLDLYSNEILDREPAANSWDVQYSLFIENDSKRKIGLLLNDKNSATIESSLAPSECIIGQTYDIKLNSIGTSWYTNEADTLNALEANLQWKIRTSYGNYTLNLVGINSESNTLIFNHNLCASALGIDDETNAPFDIYPVPASEKIFISENIAIAQIGIYDFNGRKVLSRNFDYTNSAISLAELQNGMYLLNLETPNGKTYYKKFVVAH